MARRKEEGAAPSHEDITLSSSAGFLLDECRMVLPGIQTLFGFQLVAVFTERFAALPAIDQRLHLVAIGLVAMAIAIIMAPAAIHRHLGVRQVTESFIVISNRLLLTSMWPLALAISIDFYLIADLVLGGPWVTALATALFGWFLLLWLVVPRMPGLHPYLDGSAGRRRTRANGRYPAA